ncbi:oxidoreductase [Streptomyces thinghirensis]|uniref:NAD(P)-binding protein n=1 Tax=Streptomyces thinghirensis TaxID=551547 RepID=A0ABP9T8J6_9ACTN
MTSDTRDPRHDCLFEPVQIGPKTMKNRFYAVAHSAGLGTTKPFSQAAFRGMKAEGGWAAVCSEYAPVSQDSDESPSISARIWDADDARNLALMAEEVHEHGALAGLELTHLGGYASRNESRVPSLAPTAFPSPYDPTSVPKEMDLDDIARVRRDWTLAARRARDVGFDIVYVYGCSDLPFQFLSPHHNRRTDGYGGSLDNRARLWLELLQDVKEAVGDECAVATRMSMEALLKGGVETDEILKFVEMADPLVDLWDINMESLVAPTDTGPSRFYPQGYQLETTSLVRSATQKPIVGVGRLTDPDRMAQIISSGALDIIGGARPSIADPFLPAKIESGRYSEIRECIGCNVCVMKAEIGGHIGCTQNATAGEEYRRGWHPERYTRATNSDSPVLVVGAGPSGMECAITLAKRGFEVHVAEAEDEVGGHLNWVRQLPGLAEWGRTVEWRAAELTRLPNAQVLTGTRLTDEQILNYGAEIVVLATGASWASDGVSAFAHDPVPVAEQGAPAIFTPEQILVDGIRSPGDTVIVYDADGYFVGPGMAELLAVEGFNTTLVTPLGVVAPKCDYTLEGELLRRRLRERGVQTRTQTTLGSVDVGAVTLIDETGTESAHETSAIVTVTRRVPSDSLYRSLRAATDGQDTETAPTIYRVGDCLTPRIIADAIFDGHRLAMEIDGPDPTTPLPYARERAVVPLRRTDES